MLRISDLKYRALPCCVVQQVVGRFSYVPSGYMKVGSNKNDVQRKEEDFYFSNANNVQFQFRFSKAQDMLGFLQASI